MVISEDGTDGLAKGEEIALKGVRDGEAGALFLKRAEGLEGEDGLGLRKLGLLGVEFEDFELGGIVRQAHRDREEEAVELRLGKREGSSGGGVVLGGDDHEGIGACAGFTIDRDLALVHRFEKR